jgi:hypothetical protein
LSPTRQFGPSLAEDEPLATNRNVNESPDTVDVDVDTGVCEVSAEVQRHVDEARAEPQDELLSATIPLNDSPDTADLELQRALEVSAKMQRDADEARADAQMRLCSTLARYQAAVRPVEADGNCQFRAIAVHLCGDEGHHAEVRARVVAQLRELPSRYSHFVYEPFQDYINRMACEGQWGDNVTLQAASDAFNREIQVLTDNIDADCLLVRPAEDVDGLLQKPLRSVPQRVCVTFLTETHYDAAFLRREQSTL